MSTFKFNNPDHILVIGQLPPIRNANAIQLFSGFYRNLAFIYFFDAEEFIDMEIGEILKKSGQDFCAIYDPESDSVVSSVNDEFMSHWLDSVLPNEATKQNFPNVVKHQVQQVFATDKKDYEQIAFNKFILGH